jgi:ParB family transcriptional regulator, chromosome partitioning protein
MNEQEIINVPIANIFVTNPRTRNRKKWAEIVTSIGAVGLKRPITVSKRDAPTADGKEYDLVCGQGRIEAFVKLGETVIPAIVTSVSREDQALMSLVENLARRQPSNRDVFREVKALRAREYTADTIAEKLGIDRSLAYGLINLIERGEESLVEHVEAGRLPISIAIEIAHGSDDSVSIALSDAYQSGELRGAKLRAVRRLVAARATTRKPPEESHHTGKRVTAGALVKVYEQTVRQQQALVTRAEKVNSELVLLSSVFRELMTDACFAALLQQENLSHMPERFAARLAPESDSEPK